MVFPVPIEFSNDYRSGDLLGELNILVIAYSLGEFMTNSKFEFHLILKGPQEFVANSIMRVTGPMCYGFYDKDDNFILDGWKPDTWQYGDVG